MILNFYIRTPKLTKYEPRRKYMVTYEDRTYPEPQVPLPAYLFPGGATYSCLNVAGSGFQRKSPVSESQVAVHKQRCRRMCRSPVSNNNVEGAGNGELLKPPVS